eukprot:gnl/TRDRNA2_/TRDRNA2_191379_c0_seq1.p1 gnl/TRDRNA2_/TRDRNA2_191379_c0~~gnl/TRDRNA2_/TRDRNA2_191379_c0_seq1.p1  ORF type:complete len:120 (+),score=10.24 gnl/TRDRNA2_/TRDRNA2_191379_c0_seq1:96-455(+)
MSSRPLSRADMLLKYGRDIRATTWHSREELKTSDGCKKKEIVMPFVAGSDAVLLKAVVISDNKHFHMVSQAVMPMNQGECKQTNTQSGYCRVRCDMATPECLMRGKWSYLETAGPVCNV